MTRIKASAPQAPSSVPVSVNELARQQGVAAVDNLEEVASLWPVDDDPDEMMRFILRERAERRTAAPTKIAPE